MNTNTFDESKIRREQGRFAVKPHSEAEIDLGAPIQPASWLDEHPGGGTVPLYAGSGNQGQAMTEDEVRHLAHRYRADVSTPEGFSAFCEDQGLRCGEERLLTDPAENDSDPDSEDAYYGDIDPYHWDTVQHGGFQAGSWYIDRDTGEGTITSTRQMHYQPADVGATVGTKSSPWQAEEEFNEDFDQFMEQTYGVNRIDDDVWELEADLPDYPTESRATQAWEKAYSRLDRAEVQGGLTEPFRAWMENCRPQQYSDFMDSRS